MHKRLHKVVSLAMAGLVLLTSTLANVNQSYAAETVQNGDAYETTYAIAELGTPGGYHYTTDETENGLAFNYSEQYAEVQYAIPEDVVKAGLKGYKVNVSKTENLGLKIYSSAGEAAVAYWSSSVSLSDDTIVPTRIGFMNCAEGENVFEFSSVTFVTARELGVEAPADPEEPVEPGEPEEPTEPETPSEVKELVFNENLIFQGRWGGGPTESNVLSFSGQYSEYVYDLGTTLSAAQVENVVVAVSEQGNDFSIKLYDEGMNEKAVEYHNTGDSSYSVNANYDGNLRYVAIMSIPEGEEAYPYSVTIDSITVKLNGSVAPVEPEKPVEEKGVDVYTDFYFADRWGGAPSESSTLEFAGQYQEYVFDLGKTYDANDVEYVLTEVSDQGNEICIKFYDGEMNELFHEYHCKESDAYSLTPDYDGELRYIGIMSMPGSAEGTYPYSVTIKKITVKYIPKVYEETQYYNAENLVFVFKGDGQPVEGNYLEFTKEWDEYRFELTKPVRGDRIKSVKVTVSGESNLDLCFKFYSGTTEVLPLYHYSDNATHELKCTVDDEITGIAIMAMNNQDEKFPAFVTFESAEILVDTTPDTEPPVEKGVEYDIVNLRDEMTSVLGDDFIVGCAISSAEFNDSMEMELVTKHFNGVTLGNELKPDSMLKQNAEKVMVTVGGQEILFPVLNFSTPDRYLDFFVNWNNEHPDNKIRIRGHVLVWHSQTPDFFFREDYDTSKGYVAPEVMNLRLEAYIRAVCEHYTSEGSKYKELFYGWDVVNEAISDGSGTYRNASENSTWWRVYQSPEFINNAFVYANRYMPEDIALFYNDYNAYQPTKAKGILTLIKNVQATPGSRIDGMGMQAHYFCEDTNPTMEAVKKAAKAYGELVDQVQFTEIDFKGSTGPKDEQLAKRYKDLYDTVRRLINEGTNVTGFTIWGVVDKHSWLQQQNSAGGGSNGSSKQYPLLFDNNYKAKPAFYALVNVGELEPEIKNVSMVQLVNGDFSCGEEYAFDNEIASFVPMWDAEGVKVKVNVADGTVDDTDAVTVYVSDGKEIFSATVTRSDATATETGYEAFVTVAASQEAIINNKIKLDVVVVNGAEVTAFNDTTLNQAASDKYYAVAATKPLQAIEKGTVVVDGDVNDEAWLKVDSIPLTINLGADVTATAKLLWDDEYLYVLMDVKDSVLNKASNQAHEQDSIEVFIDEDNAKSGSYQDDDKQYRINYLNERSFNGPKCNNENMLSAAVVNEDGYIVEAAFKWTDVEAKSGHRIGLELQVNDANAKGTRSGTLSWADKSGNGWSSPEVFGTAVLVQSAPTELKILQQPKDYFAPVHHMPITMTVIAQGDGLTYSWYYKNANGDGKFHKAGRYTNTYRRTSADRTVGLQAYCVIKDAYGNKVVSDVATVVPGGVYVTKWAGEYTEGKLGERAYFEAEGEAYGLIDGAVVLSSENIASYNWYLKYADEKGGDGQFHKTGCTEKIYSRALKDNLDGAQVCCIITDIYGNKVRTDVTTIRINR